MIQTYIINFLKTCIKIYLLHNYIRRLCRVSKPSVTYYESHRSRLLSLRMFQVVLSTKVRFCTRTVQPHTVHIRHKVIAVILLETSLTSTILLRLSKQHDEVLGLHSNAEVESALRERSRAQKPTSIATAEFSNTRQFVTYTSICGEIALKNIVTSVEQSCSTKLGNLF
jgi:hypothetical protein